MASTLGFLFKDHWLFLFSPVLKQSILYGEDDTKCAHAEVEMLGEVLYAGL